MLQEEPLIVAAPASTIMAPQQQSASPAAKRLRLESSGGTATTTTTAETALKAHQQQSASPQHRQQQQQQQHATASTTASATATTNNFDSLEEVATRLFMHRTRDLTRTDALAQTDKLATDHCSMLSAAATRLASLRSRHEATVECQLQSLSHRKGRLAEVEDLVSAVSEGQSQLQKMSAASAELFGVVKTFVDGASQSDVMLNAATRVLRFAGRRREMASATAELQRRAAVLSGVLKALAFGYAPSSSSHSSGADNTQPLLLSLLASTSKCFLSSSSDASSLGDASDAKGIAAWTDPSAALPYPLFISARAKAAEATALGLVLKSERALAPSSPHPYHNSDKDTEGEQHRGIAEMVARLRAATAPLQPRNEIEGGIAEGGAGATASSSGNAPSPPSEDAAFEALLTAVGAAIAKTEAASAYLASPEAAALHPSATANGTTAAYSYSLQLLLAQKALLQQNQKRMHGVRSALNTRVAHAAALAEEQRAASILREGAHASALAELAAEEAALAAESAEAEATQQRLSETNATLAAEESLLSAAEEAKTAQEAVNEGLTGAVAEAEADALRIAADSAEKEATIAAALAAEEAGAEALAAKERGLRDDVAFLAASLASLSEEAARLKAMESAMDSEVLPALLRAAATVAMRDTAELSASLVAVKGEADSSSSGGCTATTFLSAVPADVVALAASMGVGAAIGEDSQGSSSEEEEENDDAAADSEKKRACGDAVADGKPTAEEAARRLYKFNKLSAPDLAALTGVNVALVGDTTSLHVDGLAASTAARNTAIEAARAAAVVAMEESTRRFGERFPNFAPLVAAEADALLSAA